MKLSVLGSLICFCILFTNCEDSFEAIEKISNSFENHINEKIKEIKSTSSHGGFVFITDTHLNGNKRNSAKLIQQTIINTPIDLIIFGGDVVGAYGTKAEIIGQWQYHEDMYNMTKSYGKLINTRGNHDFTNRHSSADTLGYTYSQTDCAKLIYSNMTTDIVRPANNDSACYYYHDDLANNIRYIVLESTDRTKSGDVYWGNIDGIGKTQLDWVANTAIKSTPSGYGIIFIAHIPIELGTNGNRKFYSDLSKIVGAVNKKDSGNIGLIEYDFSKLDNVKALMFVSGHYHHDMQTFKDGILHVLTACDAAYGDVKSDPLLKVVPNRNGINSQCFDCFTISKDRNTVIAIRVGYGGNRTFHMQPIIMKSDDTISLQSGLEGSIAWCSYNTSGNEYNNKKWTLINDIVNVNNNGVVSCTGKIGEAIVVAEDTKQNREFFYISVK